MNKNWFVKLERCLLGHCCVFSYPTSFLFYGAVPDRSWSGSDSKVVAAAAAAAAAAALALFASAWSQFVL